MKKIKYANRIGYYSIFYGILSIAGYFTHPKTFSKENPLIIVLLFFVYAFLFIVLGYLLVSRIKKRVFKLNKLTISLLLLYLIPTIMVLLIDLITFIVILIAVIYPIILGFKFFDLMKKESQ